MTTVLKLDQKRLEARTRPNGAAQVRLVGRSWPRAQRTLRELLRQPGRRAPQPAELRIAAYEAMDRRRGPQPFEGEDRRKPTA